MTVLEVIQRSAEFLAKKEVESPRLQVELLLAQVLRLPRMGLYLNFERVLTPPELEGIREAVKRRAQREPLQHIIGSTSFCGLEIRVNRQVLIPRPETELLAELGWQFLNAFHPNPVGDSAEMSAAENGRTPRDLPAPAIRSALDFGTGSGCLAIALAVKCPGAQIWAVDVSPEALAVARQNAARHGVQERIQFLSGDGFRGVPAGQLFDLIVANPPYIPSAEIPTLQPEVRDFDPALALDGGVDGLDFYRRLAGEAGAFLRPGGQAAMEFGDGQAVDIAGIFVNAGWLIEAVKADYSGRERILVARMS